MKYIQILLLSNVFFSTICAQIVEKNTNYYSIDYPNDWVIAKRLAGSELELYAPNREPSSVVISIQGEFANFNKLEYINSDTEKMKAIAKNFEVLYTKEDETSSEISYRGNLFRTDMKWIKKVILYKKNIYIIMITSKENNSENITRAILNSFTPSLKKPEDYSIKYPSDWHITKLNPKSDFEIIKNGDILTTKLPRLLVTISDNYELKEQIDSELNFIKQNSSDFNILSYKKLRKEKGFEIITDATPLTQERVISMQRRYECSDKIYSFKIASSFEVPKKTKKEMKNVLKSIKIKKCN